ncbi:MAG TPA: Gfo/Idh/MocA family oxidoreductase [Chloroflexota bacterium]|nr:Gfo/Idh/MocA family oxidoreductase [Chloroflexota bacterium]
MSGAELRIGIIGAGGIGREHTETYGRRENCRVVAVADVDAGRGGQLAAAAGATYYPSAARLLAEAAVDAVSVCLPHALHVEATLQAAAAGKHVLCEKPIATSLADAERMIAACRAAGVVLMIGQTHRFYPPHVLTRQLLQAGEIGRLLYVNDVIWAAHEGNAGRAWRSDVAQNGGGIFMDNGIHAADRLRWFLESEPTWVAARVGHGRGVLAGEEHGTALLGFANGVTATLQESIGVPRSAGCCYLDFVGTEGVLRVDTWKGVKLRRPGEPEQDLAIPADLLPGFDAELAEFLTAIRENRPPAVTGEDAMASLALIQAIYESARTGRSVAL